MVRRRAGRRGTPLALATLAALAALGTAACDDKKAPAGDGGPAATDGGSGPSGVASGPAVLARPGCVLVTKGGALVPKLAPGALSLAVAHGKALLVDVTIDLAASEAGHEAGRDAGKDAAAPAAPSAHAERVLLGATGAPEGEVEPVFDALPKGTGVLTFANAMTFQGELTTLSFGARRPSPSACTDGALVMNGARAGGGATRHELLTHACRTSTELRGAARQDLGIVFADGLAASDPSSPSPPVAANVWILDKLTTKPVRAESITSASPVAIEAPAVAAGNTLVAAAWVVARGATRELHVARFNRKGEMIGAVDVPEKQGVGTVTLAFEGDTLHVVWSSFSPEKNRYALKWTKWPPSGAAVPAQTIGTGVLSAIAPSLAVEGGRFLLAWAEGDDPKTAAVRVGASRNGIANIPALATAASTLGTAGSGPAVAQDGESMFVAWKEKGAEAEVRASALRCQE